MTIIEGVTLDVEKSSNTDYDWSLYFKAGHFIMDGRSKQTTPFVMRLNKADYQCDSIAPCLYNIYYEPFTSNFTILDANVSNNNTCTPSGFLVGGFQIKKCKMYFVGPKSTDNVKYDSCGRIFSKEYDKAFQVTEYDCNDPKKCQGDFDTTAFSKAFDTECIITEGAGGGFMRATVSSGFQ